jgi:hypothetical protein
MEDRKFTLVAGTVERYDDLDSGETRLRVPFDILDNAGKIVLSKNESFALDTVSSDIRATLERHLEVFTSEAIAAEADKERQAALAQSDIVAEEISNITI